MYTAWLALRRSSIASCRLRVTISITTARPPGPRATTKAMSGMIWMDGRSRVLTAVLRNVPGRNGRQFESASSLQGRQLEMMKERQTAGVLDPIKGRSNEGPRNLGQELGHCRTVGLCHHRCQRVKTSKHWLVGIGHVRGRSTSIFTLSFAARVSISI